MTKIASLLGAAKEALRDAAVTRLVCAKAADLEAVLDEIEGQLSTIDLANALALRKRKQGVWPLLKWPHMSGTTKKKGGS